MSHDDTYFLPGINLGNLQNPTGKKKQHTLPETHIFAAKNGWLEYNPFLFGFRPIFRGEMAVSFREGREHMTNP